jgi:leucyl-tRNA synthetase
MAIQKTYSPADIEPKWQAKWEATKLYKSSVDWSKPKHYALTMLPYPSGNLHIGHWFAMTPSDARARFMRMKGYNVLFPMGFDAFGLPAENAAITRNIHPAKWTHANIEHMRGQLRSMGAMFDWDRSMESCEPIYYKWTEWFFKTFYEHDLAYRGEALVNWSETLQTVLANEQVIDGKDERTGQPVVQKMMTQWFFRYKRYADEMLDFSKIDWPEPVKIMQTNWIGRSEGANVFFPTEGGDQIEVYTTRPDTLWGATFMVLAPEHKLVDALTTPAQADAIRAYREQAATATEIERTSESREKTGVFTGSYAVNPVSGAKIPVWIADYVMSTYGTGAIMAVPFGDQRDFEFARKFGLTIIPVIQPAGMAEPITAEAMTEAYTGGGVMINSGVIDGIENNALKGRKNPAIDAAIAHLEEKSIGRESVNYRLRDWLISRQRYWGSPIPILHRADGTMQTVPDDQLPVLLPEDVDFLPSGRSPLTYHEPFFKTTAPDGTPAKRETDTMDTFMCSSWYHLRYLSPQYTSAPFDPEEAAYWLPVDVYTGGAEHATMHLLYTRWFNKAIRDLGVFDDALKIAAEHGRTDEGLFDEPMLLLRNQGQVLGAERLGDRILAVGRNVGNKLIAERVEVIEGDLPPVGDAKAVFFGELMRRTENILHLRDAAGGEMIVEVPEGATVIVPSIDGENNVNQLKHHLEIQRMSKSKGNVVDPDALVAVYGADVVRSYLMFGFDWQKGGPWNDEQISGVVRWMHDVWELVTAEAPNGNDPAADRDLERAVHKVIRMVENGLESFSFNTAIAALMGLRNTLKAAMREGKVSSAMWRSALEANLLLMAPFAPHISEELWERMGNAYSVHHQRFPQYDADKAKDDNVELVIMVNGKPREKVVVAAGIDEETAIATALASEIAVKTINGGQPKKVIFIAGRGGQEPKVNIVM